MARILLAAGIASAALGGCGVGIGHRRRDEPFSRRLGHSAMATLLSGPLTRLFFSAGFFGATLIPFARICLGC